MRQVNESTLLTLPCHCLPDMGQRGDINTSRIPNISTANHSINITSPGGQPPVEMTLTDEWKIGMTVAYIAVFIVAITGNSLVLYLIRTIREMRRIPFNYFMVNMAAADIVSALFTVPLSINVIFHGRRWLPGIAGIILCRLANFGLHISIATSIFTLTLMAVDRYLLIVRTMNKSLTFRSVKLSVLATWLCAAAVFSTELYKYTIKYDPSLGPICTVDWYAPSYNLTGVWSLRSEHTALIVKFILCYALPLPVLFTAYFLIMWRLWKRKNRGQFSGDKQILSKITVQNRKVVQMLLTVLTAFAICWLPVYIVHFFELFDEEGQPLLSPTVRVSDNSSFASREWMEGEGGGEGWAGRNTTHILVCAVLKEFYAEKLSFTTIVFDKGGAWRCTF